MKYVEFGPNINEFMVNDVLEEIFVTIESSIVRCDRSIRQDIIRNQTEISLVPMCWPKPL